MNLYWIIFIYILLINSLGTFLMYYDKKRAIKGEWRVKERTLFNIAFLGGAVGIWIGARRYRHKTHHASFKYGIPAIFVTQLILLGLAIYYLYRL